MAVPTLGGTCLTRARQPLTQPPPMSIYMREGTSISTSHRHSHQAPRSSHIGHHHHRDGLGSSRPTPGHGPGWPTFPGQRTESLVGTQKGLPDSNVAGNQAGRPPEGLKKKKEGGPERPQPRPGSPQQSAGGTPNHSQRHRRRRDDKAQETGARHHDCQPGREMGGPPKGRDSPPAHSQGRTPGAAGRRRRCRPSRQTSYS